MKNVSNKLIVKDSLTVLIAAPVKVILLFGVLMLMSVVWDAAGALPIWMYYVASAWIGLAVIVAVLMMILAAICALTSVGAMVYVIVRIIAVKIRNTRAYNSSVEATDI